MMLRSSCTIVETRILIGAVQSLLTLREHNKYTNDWSVCHMLP